MMNLSVPLRTGLVLFCLLVVSVSCGTHALRSTPHDAPNTVRFIRAPAQAAASPIRPGFVAIDALDPAKKTVCAMTLNSDEEILQFRKNLSLTEFQFVELVDDKEEWLSRACRARVKCDILVVSGHFGGSFFGDKGRLELTELEENTCGQSCSGIFHEPKEVFLFGCNTLAGKGRDRRTPEEYRRVLIADGFNRAQADQIVALRYSPMGQTFSDRMARVFAGVPRIYGFTSVGPSGANVEPMLADYFKRQGNYGRYMDNTLGPKVSSAQSQARNKNFLGALRQTVVEQVAGANRSPDNIVPMCFVRDRAVGDGAKVRWVHKTLKDPKTRLLYLNEILAFLNQTRAGGGRGEEMQLVKDIVADTELRTEMRNLVETGLKEYPLLRFDTLKVGAYFGWFTLAEVAAHRREFLNRHLRAEMTVEDIDLLCSVPSVGEYVTVENLQGIRGDHIAFLHTISCLAPQDVQVHWKLYEMMKAAYELEGRSGLSREHAGPALAAIKISDKALIRAMTSEMLMGTNKELSNMLKVILGTARRVEPEIVGQLIRAVEPDSPDARADLAAGTLLSLKPTDPLIHRRLLKALRAAPTSERRSALIGVLGATSSKDPEIHGELLKWVLDDRDRMNQSAALWALGQQKEVSAEIIEKLMMMAYSRDMGIRGATFNALGQLAPRNPKVVETVAYAMKAFGDSFDTHWSGLNFMRLAAPEDPDILKVLIQLSRIVRDEMQQEAYRDFLRSLAPRDPKIRAELRAMGIVY